MSSFVTGTERQRAESLDLGRVQFGVVVLMLVMSVSWLIVYSTVLAGGNAPVQLSAEIAARLSQQHDEEIRMLQMQMVEIYGGAPPPPAGS